MDDIKHDKLPVSAEEAAKHKHRAHDLPESHLSKHLEVAVARRVLEERQKVQLTVSSQKV